VSAGSYPKTISAHVLADVVRATHSDGRYVDPELAAEAISSAGDSPLTPREADVLDLAAGGAPIEEIAHPASLSPHSTQIAYPPLPPNSAPPTATKPSTSPAPAAGYDAGLPLPKRHGPLGPATDGSHDELHVAVRTADPL
jgi:hypothetical protein